LNLEKGRSECVYKRSYFLGTWWAHSFLYIVFVLFFMFVFSFCRWKVVFSCSLILLLSCWNISSVCTCFTSLFFSLVCFWINIPFSLFRCVWFCVQSSLSSSLVCLVFFFCVSIWIDRSPGKHDYFF